MPLFFADEFIISDRTEQDIFDKINVPMIIVCPTILKGNEFEFSFK